MLKTTGRQFLLLFLFFITLGQELSAQISFRKTYGNGGASTYCGIHCDDGSYALVGYVGGIGAGMTDAYIIKTNPYGEISWSKTFGGTADERGNSIAQTSDGGLVVTGFTQSFGAGNKDVYLIRLNSDGDTLWTRTYGGSDSDEGSSVIQTHTGNFLICGRTKSYGTGSNNIYLILIDGNGNLIWTKVYSNSDYAATTAIQTDSDGGYLVLAKNLLIKTDIHGAVLWVKKLGITGYGLTESSDGNYVVTGSMYSGDMNISLLKLDLNGNRIWSRYFYTGLQDIGTSVSECTDNGFVLSAYSYSTGVPGSSFIRLIKTDANGAYIRSSAFQLSSLYDMTSSAGQTADGFFVAGTAEGFSSQSMYIIKTDLTGNTCNGGDNVSLSSAAYSVSVLQDSVVESSGGSSYSTSSLSAGGGSRYTVCSYQGNLGQTEEEPSNLEIYPNPVSSLLKVNFKNGDDRLDVTLSDRTGRIVFETTDTGEGFDIDFSGLAPGIFFLSVFKEGSLTEIRKISHD